VLGGGVVSVGVCARKARERKSPLDGENQDELDADAARYRGARYEWACRYDVAERHRHSDCPRSFRVSTSKGPLASWTSSLYHR